MQNYNLIFVQLITNQKKKIFFQTILISFLPAKKNIAAINSYNDFKIFNILLRHSVLPQLCNFKCSLDKVKKKKYYIVIESEEHIIGGDKKNNTETTRTPTVRVGTSRGLRAVISLNRQKQKCSVLKRRKDNSVL